MGDIAFGPSQRSLQNEPIFRLLLKVAVIGAHQCEYNTIFFGALPQQCPMPWGVDFFFGFRGEWILTVGSNGVYL